jgi:hypothetical protein
MGAAFSRDPSDVPAAFSSVLETCMYGETGGFPAAGVSQRIPWEAEAARARSRGDFPATAHRLSTPATPTSPFRDPAPGKI